MPLKAFLPALLSGLAALVAVLASDDAWIAVASAVLGALTGSLPLMNDAVPTGTPKKMPYPEAPPADLLALKSALEALPFGVLIVGPDQTIRHANEPVAEMFGLPQTVGLPVATLRVRRLLDGVAEAFSDGQDSTLEFTLTRMGDAHLLAYINPIGHGETRQVMVAVLDQTQERRAQELHRDFVANASHELKTPLAAVSGVIETLLGAARQDPKATERFLGLLSEQTDRMTRLIEDLLSLNRIELNARVMPDEPQDVIGVVAEVIDVLGTIAERAGVKLVFEPPDEAPLVLADRDEIGQLFSNLIDNAIKYGGKGTEVRITGKVGTPEHEDMLVVSVSDDGPGIPREDLPRLTERFYRVNIRRSREKGGTGLGLAICKHIVTRHRGRLEIDSRVGKGSRFTVLLPVLRDEPPSSRQNDMGTVAGGEINERTTA